MSQQIQESDAFFTIPNIITLARFGLVVIFFAFGIHGVWGMSALVFGIAASSDLIDGFIARRLGQVSRLGAFLDPMADKIMMLGGLALLTVQEFLPWWLLGIVVGRDLLIVNGIFYFMSREIQVTMRPTVLSKMTTFFQVVTISIGFVTALQQAEVFWARPLYFLTPSLTFFIWVASFLTVITAIQYFNMGLDVLKKQSR